MDWRRDGSNGASSSSPVLSQELSASSFGYLHVCQYLKTHSAVHRAESDAFPRNLQLLHRLHHRPRKRRRSSHSDSSCRRCKHTAPGVTIAKQKSTRAVMPIQRACHPCNDASYVAPPLPESRSFPIRQPHLIRSEDRNTKGSISHHRLMDPRHKLYKTLDNLAIAPDTRTNMSARTDEEAANVQATSGVTMEGLERKLKEGLGATYVEIEDLSGT